MNRTYKCWPQGSVSLHEFSLRPIDDAYIEDIRQWRNAQLDVLRQPKPISPSEQTAYFQNQIWPTLEAERPNNLLVVLLQNGQAIGYGGLVHISWADKRAEVSFLVTPEIAMNQDLYRKVFLAFLSMLQIVAFEHLNFERLFTETYDIRPFHISVLEEAGFILEGTMKKHVIINGEPKNSLIHGLLKTNHGN